MTAQVIYLNTNYFPDWYELQELDRIQYELELYRAELAYLTRDLAPEKARIFIENSHRNLRKNMNIVKPIE